MCRILVVDDSSATRRLLSILLKKLGPHEIESAHDGGSALALAASFQPEIVLLDIGLPDISGYEVGVKLRELPGSDEWLIVALTGYGQAEDRRKSEESGFDVHLVKPPSLEQIEMLLTHPKLASVK